MWSNSVASNNYREVFGVVTKSGEYLVTQTQGFSGGQVNGLYQAGDGRVFYYFPRDNNTPAIAGLEYGRVNGVDVWAIEIRSTVHTHTPCLIDGTDGVSHPVGDDDKQMANDLPNLNHFVIGCNGATAQFNSSSPDFYNKGGFCSIIYKTPTNPSVEAK